MPGAPPAIYQQLLGETAMTSDMDTPSREFKTIRGIGTGPILVMKDRAEVGPPRMLVHGRHFLSGGMGREFGHTTCCRLSDSKDMLWSIMVLWLI